MNKLQMQYEFNGEKFEIWNTKVATIEEALKEMDDIPEENGWLYLVDGQSKVLEQTTYNGGF